MAELKPKHITAICILFVLAAVGFWYFRHLPPKYYNPTVTKLTEQEEVATLQRQVPLDTAEEAKFFAIDAIALDMDYPQRSTKTPFYGCTLRYPVTAIISTDGDWLIHCSGPGQTIDVEIGHDGVAQTTPTVTTPLAP